MGSQFAARRTGGTGRGGGQRVPRGPTRGVGSNAVISCQQPAVGGQWNKDGSSSLLVVGCWLLDTGCWLLAAGYWLLNTEPLPTRQRGKE